MSGWRILAHALAKNPISTFAVLCVAAISGFLAYMTYWQTEILASPTWCGKAIGAEKVAPGQTYQQTLEALKSCNNLLMEQLRALATNSHIDHSVFGMYLLVLVIVVIAGARAKFTLGKEGIDADVSRQDDAVDAVADAAVDKAEEIKGGQ